MSKSKQQEMPQVIMDFVKEISDSPDLYLSFFSERQALTDATELMRKQKSELATLRRELAVHKRAFFLSCKELSPWLHKTPANIRRGFDAQAAAELEAANGKD